MATPEHERDYLNDERYEDEKRAARKGSDVGRWIRHALIVAMKRNEDD